MMGIKSIIKKIIFSNLQKEIGELVDYKIIIDKIKVELKESERLKDYYLKIYNEESAKRTELEEELEVLKMARRKR